MKKKSHRKDVIIARIFFAGFCLVVIAAIAGVVLLVKGHREQRQDTEGTQMSQESQAHNDPMENTENTVDTEDTEVTEDTEQGTEPVEGNPVVRTTTGVNLRREPNTSCEVLTVLEEGTELTMLGEENGWANVDYRGRIGYVSMDYLEEVPPVNDDSQGE